MSNDTEYLFGPFLLQPFERLLLRDGVPVRIGTRAFDMLRVLVEHAGQTLCNEQLLRAVWGSTVVDEGSIRVHVASLRKILRDDGTHVSYITNAPLRGYCFSAPVTCRRACADGTARVSPSAPRLASPSTSDDVARLIGREDVVSSVCERFAEWRLVTLVGPAGIGKTSVALAIMKRIQGRHARGPYFVDLAPLSDPAFVPSAIATALGVPALAEDPLTRVVALLRDREVLIVLDNCEHVIDSAASVAEALMRRLPETKLLATSREALRAQGEWIQRLGGLSTPWGNATLCASEAMQYPALQMLVERVHASVGDYVLGDSDVEAAVNICRAMDGIPLAIELAATHVPAFGLRQLSTLLSDRLSVLTQGRRTALARHQTLQAALDWSHELLDGKERAVLRRLSVFRGPFRTGPALEVCVCPQIDADTAADCLVSLVNKSLVVLDASGGGADPVYRLLRTTRGYAHARLQESGEVAAISSRHASVVSAVVHRSGAQADAVAAAPEVSIDDVRVALDWALGAGGDADLGVTLIVDSAALWFRIGLVKELKDRLNAADSARRSLPADAQRDMYFWLACGHAHLHTSGPTAASDDAFVRALELARRAGSREDRFHALWSFYTDRMVRGDYAATLRVAQEFGQLADTCVEEAPRLTHHRMMAMSLHMEGRHLQALEHSRQAMLSPATRTTILHGASYQVDHRTAAMVPLARIRWMQGHWEEALALSDDAAERAASIDDGISTTFSIALAACPIALWCGDLERARRHTRLLQDCAVRHTLEFWQAWGQMYEQILVWLTQPSGPPHWLPRCAAHPGRADMLGTLSVDLISEHALQRLAAGRNMWCAAELRRAHAVNIWRRGADPATVEPEIRQAVGLAQSQGALAWELRATTTLAELLQERGQRPYAASLLEELLGRLEQRAAPPDHERACGLLRALRS